jgi:hypothetical protein
MSKKPKKYWEMTAAELVEATNEFDREFVAETFRLMTSAEEKAWRAAVGKRRHKPARATRTIKVVPVAIDKALLKRVDALAKKRGLTRDRLVADGLEALLANGQKGA